MLSPKQAAFVKDPARFKLARAGRRSGKTVAGAAYMILEALSNPSTPILYIGLTREAAKEAVWGTLITILDELGIEHEARPSALRIKFPNGSFIRLFGADASNAKDRLRGQKYKLVIIDECGFYQSMDAIIPVVIPMLADYAGTLAMTSSPGVLLSGYFYECDVGDHKDNWSQHLWDMKDNKFFQKAANDPSKYANRAEEELDTICKVMFGGNRLHPGFVREYLGQWVRDNSALIYPLTDVNLIEKPYDIIKPQYGIGVDIGVSSASAISVIKYSEYSREVQIVETWSEAEVLIDDFANILKDYMAKYNTDLIVADTGGLGAAVVQELRKRYSLPVKAAVKTDKSFHQRIFANDMLSGYIKCVNKLGVVKEWSKIVKDENGEEIKGQKNHEADACLYIYRYIYSTYLKDYTPPQSDEDIMIEQLAQQALRERDWANEEKENNELYI